MKCNPDEVVVKSFFLGPQAENADWLKESVNKLMEQWFVWRKRVNGNDGPGIGLSDAQLEVYQKQQDKTWQVLNELFSDFEQEIPKFQPRYMGHMFSDMSLPAFLGHILTLMHNPNNISSESSFVGTTIEKKALFLLGRLCGFKQTFGHFCSGGTLANYEFLYRARERMGLWLSAGLLLHAKGSLSQLSVMGWDEFKKRRQEIEKLGGEQCLLQKSNWQSSDGTYGYNQNPFAFYKWIFANQGKSFRPVLFAPASKHYGWPKALYLMGFSEDSLCPIDLDANGRMSVEHLKASIDKALCEDRPILGVVGVLGTTELGTFDPIHRIHELLMDYQNSPRSLHIWFHVDAAYGGFYRSLLQGKTATYGRDFIEPLGALEKADSLTIDPHKLGYVPYASGAFLCQSSDNYKIRSFLGPYIQSDDSTIGHFTLEGSRSAAGSVATYASLRAFEEAGSYGKILARGILAKNRLSEILGARQNLEHAFFDVLMPKGLDTNILCFAVAVQGQKSLQNINNCNQRLFKALNEPNEKGFWVSKTQLSFSSYHSLIEDFCLRYDLILDDNQLFLIRLTLMNPFLLSKEFHLDFASEFKNWLSDRLLKLVREQ